MSKITLPLIGLTLLGLMTGMSGDTKSRARVETGWGHAQTISWNEVAISYEGKTVNINTTRRCSGQVKVKIKYVADEAFLLECKSQGKKGRYSTETKQGAPRRASLFSDKLVYDIDGKEEYVDRNANKYELHKDKNGNWF